MSAFGGKADTANPVARQSNFRILTAEVLGPRRRTVAAALHGSDVSVLGRLRGLFIVRIALGTARPLS